jgi:hypothetical protein
MIEPGGPPGAGTVAIIAGVVTLNMTCVFASGCSAIVARKAGRCDIAMVKPCRFPGAGIMAIVTGVIALHVCRVLTFCRCAIVATEAGAGNISMVKSRG